MNELIGRYDEIERLRICYESGRSELVIISGRRRIGKTFLINSVYKNKFDFYYTGGHNLSNTEQLMMFAKCLRKFSNSTLEVSLKNWFEAFSQLESYLETLPKNRIKIIFLDEMPWIDSHNSKFVKALEYFWNSWAAQRNDIMLISSGSATSWINDKLIENQGGLHNRITCQIFLEPFTLKETEEFLEKNGFVWDRYTVLQVYMILGGVPFYLSLLDNRLSLPQNVDSLCFSKKGVLKIEFYELFSTLFSNSEKYVQIVKALSEKNLGLTRQEIIEKNWYSGQYIN